MRTLTAAEHDKIERRITVRRDIGNGRCLYDRRPHGIACYHGLAGIGAGRRQEAARNRLHAGGKRLVGAPHHSVLLMHEARHAEPRRGKERWHGGITAKANDSLWPQLADQLRGEPDAAPQGPRGAQDGNRVFGGKGGRRNGMDRPGRKLAGKALRTAVGHEMDIIAAIGQRMGQRLSRKQMPASATGGEKNDAFGHEVTPPARYANRGTGCAPAPAFPAGVASAPG